MNFQIKKYNKLNDSLITEIKALEKITKDKDEVDAELFLDTSLNFYPELNSILLAYDKNILVGIMIIFLPTNKEVELSFITHPDFRKKGIFNLLFEETLSEIKKFSINSILVLTQNSSQALDHIIKKLELKYEFSEYYMIYPKTFEIPEFINPDLQLSEVIADEVEELARVGNITFEDDYSNSLSIIKASIEAEDKLQYSLKYKNKIIGLGAVTIEDDNLTIYGLGILPDYQGKGFGKALVYLILNDLKRFANKQISLEVNSENTVAYNLYKKLGFEVKTKYDYYRKDIKL